MLLGFHGKISGVAPPVRGRPLRRSLRFSTSLILRANQRAQGDRSTNCECGLKTKYVLRALWSRQICSRVNSAQRDAASLARLRAGESPAPQFTHPRSAPAAGEDPEDPQPAT